MALRALHRPRLCTRHEGRSLARPGLSRRRTVAAVANAGASGGSPPPAASSQRKLPAARAYVGALWPPQPRQQAAPAQPPQVQQQQQQKQQQQSAGERESAQAARPAHHAFNYSFIAPNWRPLVGRSRQHQRVEREVLRAAGSKAPLVISGDAGLNKLQVAASVHALGLSGEDVSHPLVVVDCSTAAGVAEATQLLLAGHAAAGATGSMDVTQDPVLLSALPYGTLVLNNMHRAPRRLLALADEAVANLCAGQQQQQRQQQREGVEQVPGQLLQQYRTRLIIISQLPLAKLAEQLLLPQQPGAPAGAGAGGLAGCASLAVPPLRARASDIVPLAVEAGLAPSGLRGYRGVDLSEAAQLQLTSYDWPGNEAELQGLVKRAIMLHPPAASSSCAGDPDSSLDGLCACGSADEGDARDCCGGGSSFGCAGGPLLVLDAPDFWGATGAAERGRIDVLEVFPWLRRYVLNTGLWPVGLNQITRWLYPLIVASLFLGPQDRDASAALTVFWAGWWPIVMLSFPFVGRAWCAICPFMLTGEVAQDLVTQDAAAGAAATSAAGASGAPSARGPAGVVQAGKVMADIGHAVSDTVHKAATPLRWRLKHWPAEKIDAWAGWFVVSAFSTILVWEEVWDLPGHAYLSGWLLLLITAGAVACSVVFEKRLWCRYLCPIGAMNGLFAKLSMTEIRSRPGLCAAAACAKPCHNGRIEHHIVEVPTGYDAADAGACPALAGMLADSQRCSPAEQAGCPSCSPGVAAAPAGGGWLGQLFNWRRTTTTVSGGDCAAGGGASLAPLGGASTTHVVEDEYLPGCPINSSPGSHLDNQACIMCGNCLRSCTGHSAQWRLRPPASDLWGDHVASWPEVSLMYVLLGSVLLHRLPGLCGQLGLPEDALASGGHGPHVAASALLLAAPLGVAWLWSKAGAAATRRLEARAAAAAAARGPAAAVLRAAGAADAAAVGGEEEEAAGGGGEAPPEKLSFMRLSYSMLPLVWAGILAHYEDLLLTELGLTAPRLALSLGAAPGAAWLAALPTLGPAPDAVVSAAQGLTLFVGAGLAYALAGKMGAVEVARKRASQEAADRAVLPQRLLILAAAAELWALIV